MLHPMQHEVPAGFFLGYQIPEAIIVWFHPQNSTKQAHFNLN
jgi:hypothetical protein